MPFVRLVTNARRATDEGRFQREILPVLAPGDGDLPAEEGNCLRLGVVRPVGVLPTCFVFRDAEAARWPQLRATAPSSALRIMLGNAIYRA